MLLQGCLNPLENDLHPVPLLLQVHRFGWWSLPSEGFPVPLGVDDADDPRMLPDRLPILAVDLQHKLHGLLALEHRPAAENREEFIDYLLFFAHLLAFFLAGGHEVGGYVARFRQGVEVRLGAAHGDVRGDAGHQG